MTDGPLLHADLGAGDVECLTCGRRGSWGAGNPVCPGCGHSTWCWSSHPDQPDRGVSRFRRLRAVDGHG